MLLVLFIYLMSNFPEPFPDGIFLITRNGTRFPPLLMKLLQFSKALIILGSSNKFLGLFTEFYFGFKVLFKIKVP
jgi:hypothetical protein